MTPRGILSYALFRSPSAYWRGDRTDDVVSAYARFLPVLVRVHHAIWPGYEMRVHHDDAVRTHAYFPALEAMHERGIIKLVPCGPAPPLTQAMLWRMRPLFEEDNALVVACDIDALPLLRLRRMVEEFARSPLAVMVVHGCETHDGVLGGGIGARGRRFRELVGQATWAGFIESAGRVNWHAYATDEEWLRLRIWPRVMHEAIVFRNSPTPSKIPIPHLRTAPSAAAPDDILVEVSARGDSFAPYIGSAGYEVAAAFDFYQGLPLPVMQEIRQCEGDGLDLRQVMRL